METPLPLLHNQIHALLRGDEEAADIFNEQRIIVDTLTREEAARRLTWLQNRARSHAKGRTWR